MLCNHASLKYHSGCNYYMLVAWQPA